jgi:hypothetical protein
MDGKTARHRASSAAMIGWIISFRSPNFELRQRLRALQPTVSGDRL